MLLGVEAKSAAIACQRQKSQDDLTGYMENIQQATQPAPARAPARWPRLVSGAITFAVLIAISATLYVRNGAGKSASEPGTNAARSAVFVSVAPVRREDLANELKLSAEFLPFQEISVYARVAGYVRQMKVDVGDRVKAGDVLAVLEIPELDIDLQRAVAATERAEQEVIRAKAAYDEAHVRFERLSEVLKQQPNLIAQQEIDEARARDETLRASWIAARSAEHEANASQARYKTMVAYSRITAPFPGVVTKRYADTGSLVGAGTGSGSQALVRLSQVDPLRLTLPVPESAAAKIKDGIPLQILIQSTGQSLSAKIARSSGRIATETRTMQVEVDVPNPGLTLAPGMYATAILELEVRKNALSIPVDSLQQREGNAAGLLVLNKMHKIEARKIETGLETPTRIEAVSGLDEGDLVVLGGRGRYQPGQSAEPRLLAESPKP